MNDDKELIADALDMDGPSARWMEREMQAYLAHAVRSGTPEGFRAHVSKMIEANPDVLKMMIADFIDALHRGRRRTEPSSA
jgi:hypothetical protein